MSRRVARVLLDSPLPQLDRLFDYVLPPGIEATVGVRVRVPLRSAGRVLDGFIIEIAEENDESRVLSEIESVVSPVPVVPARLFRLVRAVADRSAGGASDVLRLAVPKRQVRVEKAWTQPSRAEPLSADAVALSEGVLRQYSGVSDVLSARGRAAVEAICGADAGGTPLWPRLLAAAATATFARGESAILVVPDHRDVELVQRALASLLPESIIVRNDSQQSNADRYRAFLRTLDDAPCVVIGNRSAIYAPVHAGLVAIWDDGDPLLAEPLAPYAHARDAALVRQEQEGSALLLVGHTRTTDTERLVLAGWLHEVHATPRVLPRVTLSTAEELEQPGTRLTPSAFRSAREALTMGPVLVQVARPGFAPSLICGQCRHPARCQECGGPLGAARRGAVPVCGWCARSATSWACSRCQATAFRLASSGSERTAEELGRAFPGVRVIVADAEHPVVTVSAHPALVVATRGAEPRAEGGYRGVLLLDGARMLHAPELRIAESCLRWWSNAAALATPGAPIHLVGVSGPVARAFASWSHAAHARAELQERAPLRMPPIVRVARIEGTAAAVERARQLLAELPLPSDAVLGPVPLASSNSSGPAKVRALVRFDYALGARVAATLRAAVIAEAVARRGRRPGEGRTTLAVRFDVLDPEL